MSEVALTEGIRSLVVQSQLSSDDERAWFMAKLAEEIQLFKERMLKAFPEAGFSVIIYQDTKDNHPRFFVDCNIPMKVGHKVSGLKVGGRLIIYDETREESLYHKIMRQMKARGAK